MVMREDGAPLAQVESNDESIIIVDINISKGSRTANSFPDSSCSPSQRRKIERIATTHREGAESWT